ncbi:hypothetical protein Nepgr_023397 [Nepenthes gracilis]|uniref:Glycosyltransferase N-terminal domain-containing protein n=1 Tax=Nepenthes gracilis TaxID=150966 RepID=A0AAD3XZ26_NEPGR|nr:hypothetical protein Nepgr_023397 [Nepenthes gracilis]
MGSLSISKGGGDKPHAVCVPFPAQGHINPMFKLAKLLHFRGFHITFVHTEFNRNRLQSSHGPHYLDGLPSFNFEAIPDGLPPSDTVDSTQDIPSLCFSTDRSCIGPFRELLQKLNDTNSTGAPPVSCIVSDGSMLFTLDAAEELGVPEVLLWTASACGLLGYAQYRNLVERGLTPFKDPDYSKNGNLETVIDWIPAMEGITLKYMPSFVRTTNPDDIMLNFIPTVIDRFHRASAVLFNTFSALEQSVLSALPTHFPPLYPIGPLPLLLNQLPDDEIKSLGSNLWKEDPACLEWLDSKQPNSPQTVLWVVRPDLVTGDAAILPAYFRGDGRQGDSGAMVRPGEGAKPPGLGVLTHSWVEFHGMEIDSEVKRGEVEKQVRELMEGDKGKELRRRAMKWKRLAEEATATPTGSSYLNLEDLINNVLLSTPKKNSSN